MKLRLLVDVHFDVRVCKKLRALGYEVVEARVLPGQKHRNRMSDQALLEYALSKRLPLLTDNVDDFRKLHKQMPWHEGIVACRLYENLDVEADRIHRLLKRHVRPNGRYTGRWMRLRPEFRKGTH
jgi:hypothetical protein